MAYKRSRSIIWNMEGSTEDDKFEVYQETTTSISLTSVLVTVGVISSLLFLPVFILAIAEAEVEDKRISDNDDDDDDDRDDQKIKEDIESTRLLGEPDEKNTATDFIYHPQQQKIKEDIESTRLLGEPDEKNTATDFIYHPQQHHRHQRRQSLLRSSIDTTTKRRSNVGLHRLVSAETNQICSIQDERTPKGNTTIDENMSDKSGEEEEEGCNAIRFSDPGTTAFEKLWIITCHNCDDQSRGMLKLAIPYLMQALIISASEMIQVAVVGHRLGSSYLSTYIIIDLFITLTTNAVLSIIMSGNTMIAQIAKSDHDQSPYKVGMYLQLSLIFYILGCVPLVALWSFFTKDLLLFLGNDISTAEIGQQFAIPYTCGVLIEGIASAFQFTLDVVGFEVQSTIITLLGEIGTTIIVVTMMCWQNSNLVDLGYIYLIVDLLWLTGILITIYSHGFLEDYYEGFFSMFHIKNTNDDCKNRNNNSGNSVPVIKLMLYNAVTYSFSNLLVQGEWQVMIFFASKLGKAEVAAWGVLGIIWEQLELIVAAVAEGCAIRCTLCLGSGDARTAKLVAYKSVWICFVCGVFVSIIFFIFEEDIPKLLTDDPVLQRMVSDNLSLVGMANIVAGIAIMAERLLMSQNRVTLGTAIGCVTTACISLPLAGISSLVFGFDLKGQTATLAIGMAMFGSIALIALISSDWEKIAIDIKSLHDHTPFIDNFDNDTKGSTQIISERTRLVGTAPALGHHHHQQQQ